MLFRTSPSALAPRTLQEPYATLGPHNEVRERWGCGEVGRKMGEKTNGLVREGVNERGK